MFCSLPLFGSSSEREKNTSRTWMPKIGTHKFTSTQGERMPKHRLRYAGANKNYRWRIKRIKRMNERTTRKLKTKRTMPFFVLYFYPSIAFRYWIFHHYLWRTFIHPPTHNGTKRYLRYSHILREHSINYKVVVPKFTTSLFMWVCVCVCRCVWHSCVCECVIMCVCVFFS